MKLSINVLILFVIGFFLAAPQSNFAQTSELFGIKLRPELKAMVADIETKTRHKIDDLFIHQSNFLIASSFIDDDTGVATVLVDPELKNDPKKLEAVIAHELLHLRLRVNNFPTFIWSPDIKTAKGRAIDVEQDNINDLKDLIEHRVIRSEMERYGLFKLIDIAGDTAADARSRKGQADGQVDSINYARAILEYQNPKDTAAVKLIFTANGWDRSLKTGADIAGIITASNPTTPAQVESVFLRCIAKLYPLPPALTFKLSPDPANRFFRRLVVSTAKTTGKNDR
jgi:hypothetical protein